MLLKNIVVYTGFPSWFNDCRCSGSVAAKQDLIMIAPPLCSTVTMTQLCWHGVCDFWPYVGSCIIAKHVQFGFVCLAVFSDACKSCCLLSLFREKQLFHWHCANTREYLRPTGLIEVLTLTDQLISSTWLLLTASIEIRSLSVCLLFHTLLLCFGLNTYKYILFYSSS